jgi:hypothetical protein
MRLCPAGLYSTPRTRTPTTGAAPCCTSREASSSSYPRGGISQPRARRLLGGTGERRQRTASDLRRLRGTYRRPRSVLGYVQPMGKQSFVAELRWLPELAGVHRNTLRTHPESPRLQSARRDSMRVLSSARALIKHVKIHQTPGAVLPFDVRFPAKAEYPDRFPRLRSLFAGPAP